jgi:hypothetical protein
MATQPNRMGITPHDIDGMRNGQAQHPRTIADRLVQ